MSSELGYISHTNIYLKQQTIRYVILFINHRSFNPIKYLSLNARDICGMVEDWNVMPEKK